MILAPFTAPAAQDISRYSELSDFAALAEAPLEEQLAWACFRLNVLESQAYDLKKDLTNPRRAHLAQPKLEHTLAEQRQLREAIQASCPRIAVYQTHQHSWQWREIPEFRIGDRVKVLWAEPGMEADIGRVGTVGEGGVDRRLRVWLDIDALGRLLLPEQLQAFRTNRHTQKLDNLQAKLEDLQAQRDAILAQGEVQPGCWLTMYPTTKGSGKKCGNTDGGYAFWCWQQNGKTKKKAIQPNELGHYENIHNRTKKLKAVNQAIARIEKQIDACVSVCAGSKISYKPDTTGKSIGQYDWYDSRDQYPFGNYPHRTFNITVFQWQAAAKGGLKRGKTIAKHRLSIDASPAEIEQARQWAIEEVRKLDG